MEVEITTGVMQRFHKDDAFVRSKVQPGAVLAVADHRHHLAQQHHAGDCLASKEMAAGHRVVGVADVMSLVRRRR